MKKFLLFTCVSALGLSAAAEVPTPEVVDDAYIYSMSPNGVYAVSQTAAGVRIFNLASGQEDSYFSENVMISVGLGKCVSNNGIVLGSTDDVNAEYWKDGEWYVLSVPDYATGTCLSNAITPDGSRICGSLGVEGYSLDNDVLMQIPVIWNAEGEGYGAAVLLPYPDRDISGRVPQYVTAIDISEDGKTVIGQVRDATGMLNYPLIYRENENGEWSYEVIDENNFLPEGMSFPPYPGNNPQMPDATSYMTPEEIAAYNDAITEYYTDFAIPYPILTDFMSDEERALYDAAIAAWTVENDEYMKAFDAWMDVYMIVMNRVPNYDFNGVRVSPDGKSIGGTVVVEIMEDPYDPWSYSTMNFVYITDLASGEITKYDTLRDLNLTYLSNDGLALAATSIGTASNSYVLQDGKFETMFYWMFKNCEEYAEWMEENMMFGFEEFVFNEETFEYEIVLREEMMTGRAMSNPDLSVVALSVQNLWDFSTEATTYFFDVKAGQESMLKASQESAVETVEAAEIEGKIFDLSGRQLKSVTAPGVYIINGEKKVVL